MNRPYGVTGTGYAPSGQEKEKTMNIKITPSMAEGKITAPPSKSMAHRLIICAALAEGESVISNIAMSADIKATILCMRELGSLIAPEGDRLYIKNGESEGDRLLFVNESGSTLRFLIPLALCGDKVTFVGKPRLFERPLTVYEEICKKQGILFEKGEETLCVKGVLSSGEFELPGDVSSQFISGLLLALPRLSGDSTIKIKGKFESKSYVLMTLDAMAKFGVSAEFDGVDTFSVKGGQAYTPCNLSVEGDWSNAAFFEALNFMGGEVTVDGLLADSLQGDRVYTEYFKKIKEGGARLSLADCPDLAPVLFALAAELGGAEFTDTKRLKIKESDRASAMAEELAKLGAEVQVYEDRVVVKKSTLHPPTRNIQSHNDHRIAMAMSVLLTKYGGVIEDAGAVAKSMPDFFDRLSDLGIGVTEI